MLGGITATVLQACEHLSPSEGPASRSCPGGAFLPWTMAHRKEPPFFNKDQLGSVPYKLAFYETMELFIETLTGTCFELRVSPFETVVSVKAKIQRLEGIPVTQQHLIWNSLELDDEYCLHDYNITEGCTLKLVLAMRGGPINTRRVTVENSIKEMAEYMEASREEVWEKTQPNKQVTFLVYREGDQLNFFRVVDRGDGTLTPVSESLSGGPTYNVYAEEEEEAGGVTMEQQALENSITMTKMRLLKSKMESMNLTKKPKKSVKLKPRPPVGPRASIPSQTPSHHRYHHRLLRVPPPGGHTYSATSTHLPPIEVHSQQQPSDSVPAPLPSPVASFCTVVGSSHTTLPSHPDCASVGQAPPLFASPDCYPPQQEEDSWEGPVRKIRPPPQVSRLDVSGSKLAMGCVYPPMSLFPNNSSAPSENHALGSPELKGSVVALLNEVALPETQKLVPLSDSLPEPLSLELPTQSGEEARGSLAEQVPATPLLSQAVGSIWGEPSFMADGPRLGSLHLPTEPAAVGAASTTPAFPSSRHLLQPLDTGASFCSSPPHCRMAPEGQSDICSSPAPSHSPSPAPVSSGPRVDVLGRRPGVLSRTEARDITKMANKATKEPLGTMSSAQLLATLARRGGAGREGVSEPSSPCVLQRLERICEPNSNLQARLQELQQDLLQQICPLPRTAALAVSPMSTNSLGTSGAPSIIRRLGTPTFHLPPLKPPLSSKKKSSKHCYACGKKTGLATSYECRCGNNFCASHRYAEAHDCTYDYKTAGRHFLQETNPMISAPKLPKI